MPKKSLFSIFRKKAPKEPTVAPSSQPAKNDSFADINDLIPSPQIVYSKSPVEKSPAVEKKKNNEDELDVDELYAKIEKPKKKAAPPPPQERGVDVGDLNATGPKKPPRDPKELSVEDKKAIIRKQLSEDQEEKMSRKSSISSGSRVVETNVLHYSPQTQHRPSTSSPIPVSEVPVIERQSNIILNGTQRVKSIPVSQYDGRPKQAAPPPPVPLVVQVEKVSLPAPAPPPVASSGAGAYHKKQTSLDSTMQRLNGVPKLDGPPTRPHYRPPPPPVEETRPKTKEEEDLQRRYEDIKAKFDTWQMLKNDEKHTKEAKKLQMELIRDHDTLVELVKGTNEVDVPSPSQAQKKRPSIAPDTYTPRLLITNNVRSPLTITPTYNSSNSISSSSPNSSSPGTSRSVTPKNIASSPSVSPAASVDSSDSGVVRGRGERSDYAVPKIESKKPATVDENSNLVTKRISKPRDSIELQKQNAINRINEEVRELRRKEQEIKRYSQPVMSLSLEEERPRLKQKTDVEKTELPRTNGTPPKTNSAASKPQDPKANGPSKPMPQASVSRIMVNASPPLKRTTVVQSPANVTVTSSVTQQVNGKTLVAVNQKQENIYATPKSPIKSALESPKPPPLPNTLQPKLPYMNRTMSVDETEVIYKVSTVKKDIPQPKIKEENNNHIPSSKGELNKPKRSPIVEKKSRQTTREIPVPVLEQKPEVTSAIKTTIATSRVERIEARVETTTKKAEVTKIEVKKEVKSSVKEATEKGSVSRNIADTLAKHNNQPRPALDLSAMLDRTTLRKVSPPIERNGIALGRVVDSLSQPQPSTSTPVTFIPPPPPPPPPIMAPPPLIMVPSPPIMAPPPPPPPPPVNVLVTPIYQVPSPIVRPSSIPAAPPPPLVTSSQLTDQKQRLRTPVYAEKPNSPLDLRDSLMAEIRNAGGARGLRKVNRN